jgi:hypothetical protein
MATIGATARHHAGDLGHAGEMEAADGDVPQGGHDLGPFPELSIIYASFSSLLCLPRLAVASE